MSSRAATSDPKFRQHCLFLPATFSPPLAALSNHVIKPKSESESESKNSKIYNPNPTKKPDNPDFEIRLRIRCTPLLQARAASGDVRKGGGSC